MLCHSPPLAPSDDVNSAYAAAYLYIPPAYLVRGSMTRLSEDEKECA